MFTLKFSNYNKEESVIGKFETEQKLNMAVIAWLKSRNIAPKGKNGGYILRHFTGDDGREFIDYGSWASYLIVENEE